MERNVTGGRGKVPVVVTAAVALTGLAALVAGRLRQRLRLLFQQLVQRLFHAAADQFLELPLDNFLIQLYNFLGHSLLAPFRMVCGNFILPEPASYVFFCAVFNLRNLLYLINELPYPRIQCFLMDSVGGAIGFSIPVVSTAYIFHTALAVPAADHRNERIPTFLAGQ